MKFNKKYQFGLSKLYLFILCTVYANTLFAQKVRWVVSTEAAPWSESKSVAFTDKDNVMVDIALDPSKKLQEIDGFGGCFNEIGWEALLSLPDKDRIKVMQELFSNQGANFSLCRVPIAASDYALSWYSYNDVAEDFSMRNFNIDRDRYILLPYIKAAQQVRPSLKLWGSPWSPPAWMKVNNHYTLTSGGANGNTQGDNRMGQGKNIENNATAFKMEKQFLEAYALYFSKYIKAYRSEGVDISAIQVQNEIAYAPQWPSCTWRAEDLGWFIRKYLGPRFATDSLKTKIWLGTINYGNPEYVGKILSDTATAKYITGVGFQWGGKGAIGKIGKQFPQFRLMQTESECGNGENNWKSAEYTWGLINHYLTNGANSYMYWNMVLDQTGKSSWGWPQNMLVSIDKRTKLVRYTPEFYLMKHLSHFVQPGANLILSTPGKDHLAFVNPDGTIVVVIANTSTADKHITLSVNQKKITIALKEKSFNTMIWKPNGT